MRTKYFILLLLLLICNGTVSMAQKALGYGGGAAPHTNTNAGPCITPEEYQKVDVRIQQNLKTIDKDKLHQYEKTTSTTFSFPLTYSGTDHAFWNVANYVDQDPTAGASISDTAHISDYHCGKITYDGHMGTDLAIWPFDFYKMDNDLVKDVAAADGTIIDKDDGNYDRQCAMGNNPANYVILQHADGTTSWYWHMKSGSVTTLPIGATVTTGTVLGSAGSSGSSTGPHLHFEVHAGSASTAALIDPFYNNSTASCNMYNPLGQSYWQSQTPYYKPFLFTSFVAKHPIADAPCPTTIYPISDSCFASQDTTFFYIYGANSTNGGPTLQILRPDGSLYDANTVTSGTYTDWYYYWYYILPPTEPAGIWTERANYQGDTINSQFAFNVSLTATYNGTALTTPNFYTSYQWYLNGVAISGATSYQWTPVHSGNYAVAVNGLKCTMSAPVQVTVTGVQGITSPSNTVQIYPNPATDILNVTADMPCKVTIYSMDGRTMIQAGNHSPINIKQLAVGLYEVVVRDANGIVLKRDRFVKEGR